MAVTTLAVARLRSHAELTEARRVVELGCGTGKLAADLLSSSLRTSARYTGFDVSATMVRLSRARTAVFGDRARIVQIDGSPALPLETGAGACLRAFRV